MPKTNCKSKMGSKKKRFCKKKSNLFPNLDKYEDYLLKGTYILCSSMIIFSLLMFNGLLATEGDSVVSVTNKGLTETVQDIWYDTVIFMDDAGSNIGDALEDTIQLYSRGLQNVFVGMGKGIGKAVDILTGPPPYAMAKGY